MEDMSATQSHSSPSARLGENESAIGRNMRKVDLSPMTTLGKKAAGQQWKASSICLPLGISSVA